MPDPRIDALIEQLRDDESRLEALMTLQTLEGDAHPAIPELLKLVATQDVVTAAFAVDTIGHIGLAAARAIPALCDIAANREKDLRIAALDAIQVIVPVNYSGNLVIETATTLMNDPLLDVRARAAAIMAKLDRSNEGLVPLLLEAMQSRNQLTRYVVLQSLERINACDESVIERLAQHRSDSCELVRSTLVRLLITLAPSHPAAIDVLFAGFRDKSVMVRTSACLTLLNVDMDDVYVERVLKLLDTENADLRRRVIGALRGPLAPAIAERLEAFLDGSAEDVKIAAAAVLAKAERCSRAVDILIAGIRHDPKAAVAALSAVADDWENAALAVEHLIDHSNPTVRAHAAVATYRRTKSPQAAQIIHELLAEAGESDLFVVVPSLLQIKSDARPFLDAIVAAQRRHPHLREVFQQDIEDLDPATLAREMEPIDLDDLNNSDDTLSMDELLNEIEDDGNLPHHWMRGTLRSKSGEWDDAIRDFSHGLAENPEDTNCLWGRADAYFHIGEKEKSIADLDRLIQLLPQEPEAFRMRGILYRELGDVDAALRNYNVAIELDPNDASSFFLRAIARKAHNDVPRAIQDYRQAIRLNPNDANSLNNLAYLLATCADSSFHDGAEAVRLATRANELTNWSNPSCLSTLGAAEARCGNFEAAIDRSEQALRHADSSPEFDADELMEQLSLFRQKRAFQESE